MHVRGNNDTKKVARKDFEENLLKNGISEETAAVYLKMFDEVAMDYTFSEKADSGKHGYKLKGANERFFVKGTYADKVASPLDDKKQPVYMTLDEVEKWLNDRINEEKQKEQLWKDKLNKYKSILKYPQYAEWCKNVVFDTLKEFRLDKLIKGKYGYICDNCISIASDLLNDEEEENITNNMQLAIPSQIKAHLDQYVIGQDEAKRTLAVALLFDWRNYMSEMTNERKVSILEKLLLDRDKQIRKLQEENTELQKEIESFGSDIQELQDIISETQKMNREFSGTNREMKKLKKKYEKEMKKMM